MKSLVIASILIVGLFSCKNSAEPPKLKWITIEEAVKIANGNNKKKFLVDVYTDWCGWCKVMDQKTFTDPELIKYLNENFYAVKFNAEQKEPIMFKGTQFDWQPSKRGGVNSLAVALLNGRLSYPSLVYLNANLDPIVVSPGYKEPARLLTELQSL
jgi:thioredoxin-related protein